MIKTLGDSVDPKNDRADLLLNHHLLGKVALLESNMIRALRFLAGIVDQAISRLEIGRRASVITVEQMLSKWGGGQERLGEPWETLRRTRSKLLTAFKGTSVPAMPIQITSILLLPLHQFLQQKNPWVSYLPAILVLCV
jgi:hypothetical protein